MIEIRRAAEESLAIAKSVPKPQGETMLGVPFEKRDVVRIGFVGLGGRGLMHVREMLGVDGAQVAAVSDPIPAQIKLATDYVEKAGKRAPAVEPDWKKLCARNDIDVVHISSRWDDHAEQAVHAMECGKHATVEVPAALTLTECWKLVDTSERTRRHCIMLENDCYGQYELMALNLVRQGLLGSITHGEAAYIHNLRKTLLEDHGEGLWRRKPHIFRNGNLYPTHGLGPVASYMKIHRGNRFTRLVSMSSQEAALTEHRDATLPGGDPKRSETYRCGDMNSSLLQTAQGQTVLLQHDVVTPRPYTRLNLITGSKGAFCGFPPRIFLDGDGHDWNSAEGSFQEKYDHPLWKKHGAAGLRLGGHGGNDFLLNFRIVDLIRRGLPPDFDVYDAAAISAPGPLSEISVALDSIPVPFPDFTRGGWEITRAPLPCEL